MRDSDFEFAAADVPNQDLLGGLAEDPAEAPVPRPPRGREAVLPEQPPRDEQAEFAAKLAANGTTGERSSAPVFDIGRPGLDFFRRFGPPYAAFTQAGFDHQRDIAERYDRQREIAFGKLRRDIERFGTVQEGLGDNLVNLRNAAAPVFQAWQGAAASSARAHVDRTLDGSDEMSTRFGLLGEVLAVAVRAAERIVLDKASAVRTLHAERIGPCEPDDVEFLVGLAPRIAARDVSDADLNRVAGLLELDVNPALCRRTPEIIDAVGSDVRGWLDNVFVPFFAARRRAFDAACAAAEENLAAAWQGLAEVLEAVRSATEQDMARRRAAGHQAPPEHRADESPPREPAAREETRAAASGAPSGRHAAAEAPVPSPGSEGVPTGAGAPGRADPVVGAGTTGNQTMTPSSFSASQSAGEVPAETQRPAGTSGATRGGGFAGTPFFGAFGGAQGGGDRERGRSVPLSGDLFDQPVEQRAQDIGGADDAETYNEADDAERERARNEPQASDLFDDDDDIW